MECSHKNFKEKLVEKKFLDLTFKHKAKVCSDCGAYLRGNDFERSYKTWLEEVYKNKRDKFQVQCHFSNNLIKCADNYLEDYPGVPITVFIRTLASIYLNIIDTNERLASKFNKLMDAEILNSFANDADRKRINIQFKPNMMLDIIAISEVVDLKAYQIIEDCILKMMTAITSHDQKLKNFWEAEIRSYIDVFLKGA
ncbi:MAG: hypothetical protein R3B45_18255 [Bdellovibrionota bacterium]